MFKSSSKNRQRRNNKRRWFLALLGVLALLLADYVFYPALPIGGRSFNRHENGVWLRDSWYLGKEKESVTLLTKRLKKQQLRYAYFHVRFIKTNGRLRFRGAEYAARARRLNAQLHRAAPNIKSLAWIYVGNARGLTGVDLSNAQTRRAMIQEVLWLTRECGFDGVQWDYEICEDNNADLLRLLDETRVALPRHKMISVATAMWLPGAFRSWGWSELYFSQVAARCDQLAIMGYDSALYFPRHYVWMMQQQIVRVCRAAQSVNPQCRVLLGVATYEDGGPSHHLHTENLKMGIKAARKSTPLPNFDGLAIFADYTTDENEWKLWRDWWLEEK